MAIVRACAVVSSIVLAITAWGASRGTEPSASATANSLVRAALEAEAAGDAALRASHLEQARIQFPEYAPAHWHSGQVQTAGGWVSYAEATTGVVGTEDFREYVRRRASAPLTVDDQLRLGHWCQAHNLPDSARGHFHAALALNPNSADAHKALGHVKHRYGWIVKEDWDAAKHTRETAAAAVKAWKPELSRLKDEFASNDETVCAAARTQLLAIDDAAVIPALERSLSSAGPAAAGAVVELLARFSEVQATNSLVRHAVFAPWPEVRNQAAKALKERPWHDWVPVLLSGFEPPVELTYHYRLESFAANASVAVFRAGPFADEIESLGVTFPPGDRTVETPEARRTAATIVATMSEQVRRFNEAAHERNELVDAALETSTGHSTDSDSSSWYRWWYDYNEYPYPYNRPVVTNASTVYLPNSHSCFVAGTPVLTWTGPQKIEKIRVGDCVLAQNIETGELAFKPVLGTTVGPPTKIMKLTVDGHELHLTRGHPLWVSGRGWQMAKQLKPGDPLHTVAGPLPVEAIDDWAEAATHNLVVADFNTYFVTDRHVLVHDVTQRAGTNAIVPGLQADHR